MPAPPSWALPVAIAATLAPLQAIDWPAAGQVLLLLGAAWLNRGYGSRLLGRRRRPVTTAWFLVSAPLFLYLGIPHHLREEWRSVRLLYSVLLVSAYLLLFLPCRSTRDLRRMTVLLAACFFFAATYLRSDLLVVALFAAMAALCYAFHRGRFAPGTRGHLGACWRRTAVQLFLTSMCGLMLFCVFPRGWFRAAAGGRHGGARDLSNPAQLNRADLFEPGISTRRDLLRLAHLVDFSRNPNEILRLRMTVAGSGAPYYAGHSMYLRACVFEDYGQGQWTAHRPAEFRRDGDDGQRDGWTWVQAKGAPLGPRIRQQIQMEPLDDVCFSLPEPLAIHLTRVYYDPRGVFIFPFPALMPLSYEVISALPPWGETAALETNASDIYPAGMDDDLRLPPALRPLLERTVSRLQLAGSPAQRARQLCHFLQTRFEYGPVPFAADENDDPVASFLTDSRQGYCTHFASALALMARVIGLPSRVATGLHFSEPPAQDGYYHIRNVNAHAWTEIYLPAHGWVIFDPTPPSMRPNARESPTRLAWWQFFRRFIQVDDFIEEYGPADQRRFLLELKRASLWALDWWGHRLASPRPWLVLLSLTFCLWLAFRQLPLRQRRWLTRPFSRRPPIASVPFYEDLLWLLDRHGLAKPLSATGWEHCQGVARILAAPEVEQITQQFYRVRYGGLTLSTEEEHIIHRQLRRLEQTLASRRI